MNNPISQFVRNLKNIAPHLCVCITLCASLSTVAEELEQPVNNDHLNTINIEQFNAKQKSMFDKLSQELSEKVEQKTINFINENHYELVITIKHSDDTIQFATSDL